MLIDSHDLPKKSSHTYTTFAQPNTSYTKSSRWDRILFDTLVNHSTPDLRIHQRLRGELFGNRLRSRNDLSIEQDLFVGNNAEQHSQHNIISKPDDSGFHIDMRGAILDTGNGGQNGARGGDILSNNNIAQHYHFINVDNQYQNTPREDVALPPRPPIFFGRTYLVERVIDTLVSAGPERHVALFGAGGIGKTSIARAVLNESRAIEYFKNHRFFARFDDILPSQITYLGFIERVADAMGIEAKNHAAISKHISRHPTLLVLDNAETFLDFKITGDATRIKPVIEEFGGYPSVCVLITSRNRELPPALQCTPIEVLKLDAQSAYETFLAIYKKDIDSRPILDELLSSIDYHALAVTILANAAKQNNWTVDRLVCNWKAKHADLLNPGCGKHDSLDVCIQLSLSSPSIAAFGPDVERILRLIAFLPQGVPAETIKIISRSVQGVQDIIECLVRQSLLVCKDDFTSMLVPIRLFITHSFPGPDPELLDSVRTYYHFAISQSPKQRRAIIRSEDINIETLLEKDLEILSGDDLSSTLDKCHNFIDGLKQFKPRRTLLLAKIRSVDTSGCQKLTFKKMLCVDRLSFLARFHRDFSRREELELRRWGLELAETTDDSCQFLTNSLFVADTLCMLGQFKAAEQQLQYTHSTEAWDTATPSQYALSQLNQACIALSVDPRTTCTFLADLFSLAERQFRESCWVQICVYRRLLAKASMTDDPDRIHEGLESVERPSLAIHDVVTRSAIAFKAKKMKRTKQLLGFARTACISSNLTEDATLHLYGTLAVAISQGSFQEARRILNLAGAELPASNSTTICHQFYLYYSGAVELAEQNLQAASESFEMARRNCEEDGEFKLRAMSSRAAGEVAYQERDFQLARRHFQTTALICDEAGVPPKLLYRTYYAYFVFVAGIPPATCEGWGMFLDGRFPS